ncbi:type II toxin-antitoxin system prevent-host-death family antitoxin [Sphingomonas sp.]|jgi:prevent-host-death family protein|uniref:type II toxin-antitoxin system Phd/YefM family antitoxin n=1 Tax=Sphingomonas sp. TaxID=28214 RepID=UPI002DB56C1B|nr:type II toxin-antitoxin system prevent-host-death family antitoxin [Sphingomonas sp.]HEU4968933.1 type II toxin-antitoxin system prevent-host-death family antitoxin [Sphingomonas sp.]
MRHVPLAAFKDKASEYIAAAEKGEEIIITRHGKPAAKLTTAIDREERQRRAREALDRLAQLRAKMRAEGRTATIEEMIAWKNEGQR